jgi:ADP-ribosylglycohydrolase/protein-tyrosine phosphatase
VTSGVVRHEYGQGGAAWGRRAHQGRRRRWYAARDASARYAGPMDRPDRDAGRLEGAVWGHLVGDALGVPYEFRPPAAIDEVRFGATGTHRQPPGTWSDDGALMLALLDSLLAWDAEEGKASVRFDLEDQGRRILAWHEDGAYTPDGDGAFDIGAATLAAVDALRAGIPAEQAGSVLPGALGNGSLMRILPVALVGRGEGDATLVRWASAASGVTHGEPLARAACALYVLLARRLLEQPEQPEAALADATTSLRAHATGTALEGALDEVLAFPRRTGGGYVADSLWSAWEAASTAGSYAEAVERAVRFGNDTDTTASIAGGLAGIRWGIDGIPPAWLARMRGREIAGPLVDRLLAHAGWRTSTTNPLRVDWVPLADVPGLAGTGGALGMTLLPGKRRHGYSGPHWRDPAADARRLRDAHGCSTLLLLVEDVDLEMSRAGESIPALEAAGVRVVRHPVRDMEVPTDPTAFRATLADVLARVRDGERVVVACRGGLGRTGTAVACLLVDAGVPADEAIARVREARPGTIERRVQEEFVLTWVAAGATR